MIDCIIYHDCKTSCGLIQDGLFPAGSSDLFLIFGCMTSNFLYLSFSSLYSCSLWRTYTIVFVKLSPSALLSPPPPPPTPLNVFEINKPPRGLTIEYLRYSRYGLALSDTSPTVFLALLKPHMEIISSAHISCSLR